MTREGGENLKPERCDEHLRKKKIILQWIIGYCVTIP